jgi:hypothetical protein
MLSNKLILIWKLAAVLHGSNPRSLSLCMARTISCAAFARAYRSISKRYKFSSHALAMYTGNATLDECLAQPEDLWPSCLPCPPMGQTHAFCGRDNGTCTEMSAEQLFERAWSNLRAHYFVGITEDLHGTAEILEARFPAFFAGMTAELARTRPQKVTSKRQEYVAPTESTKQALARWTDTDIKLYKRVEELYNRQRTACLVSGRITGE